MNAIKEETLQVGMTSVPVRSETRVKINQAKELVARKDPYFKANQANIVDLAVDLLLEQLRAENADNNRVDPGE